LRVIEIPPSPLGIAVEEIGNDLQLRDIVLVVEPRERGVWGTKTTACRGNRALDQRRGAIASAIIAGLSGLRLRPGTDAPLHGDSGDVERSG
jgi:hypothetical protein